MPTPNHILSSRYQSLVVWIIALGIIVSGTYLSHIAYLGYEWLSRAGCLIVVLGIWSGIGGLIQEQILIGQIRWRRRNAIIRARAALEAKDSTPADIEREIKVIDDTFDKQSFDLSQKLKVSLGIREVTILITGTLLWGFGDIIAGYLIK
jgi:hypothetical protein